jgi:hypothetical protein
MIGGICRLIGILYNRGELSWDELEKLKIYVNGNRPTYTEDPSYGWKPGVWKERRQWLKEQIKNTKD